MKIKTAQGALFAAALCFTCVAAQGQSTETQAPSPIVVTIDAQQTAPAVSKYEFGMFIEHIGSLIYRSLWSEMLDDRKFYFPINSKPDDETRRAGGLRGMQLRKWRPVGPDDVVVMDKDNPFVGDQSPRITLDTSTPHGIRQTGLALVKGKKYVGHIVARGTPSAKVQVALIWGDGANDRQTVHAGTLTAAYKSFPFTSVREIFRGRLPWNRIARLSSTMGIVIPRPGKNKAIYSSCSPQPNLCIIRGFRNGIRESAGSHPLRGAL
jgi:alpha-N-arabinofuranosidase